MSQLWLAAGVPLPAAAAPASAPVLLSPSLPQVSLSPTDTQTMVRVLRRLVAAVTRILLVADDTVVKQLLRATLSPPRPTQPPDHPAAAGERERGRERGREREKGFLFKYRITSQIGLPPKATSSIDQRRIEAPFEQSPCRQH